MTTTGSPTPGPTATAGPDTAGRDTAGPDTAGRSAPPAPTGPTDPPRPRRRGLTCGPVGVVLRPRALPVGLALLAATVALAALGVFTGDLALPPERVLAALTGTGTRLENLVVVDHRLARVLAAVLVGFALGCSGALTQSLTRNPLASPDVLGVSAGASLCAVLLVTQPQLAARSGGEPAAATLLVPAAVAGGLVTAALVLVLSWRDGFDGPRLVLTGVSVNALALSGVSWLLTRSQVEEAQVATRWLTGSLDGARMSDALALLPLALLAVVSCLVLARDLGALRMGRELSTALGTASARTELLAVLLAVLLVSGATAVAGPVSFVAFAAPQVAMRLFGTPGPPPLAGGLTAALLVLGADLLAQHLPAALPVGVPTAVLGAPYLLYLLHRYRRRSSV